MGNKIEICQINRKKNFCFFKKRIIQNKSKKIKLLLFKKKSNTTPPNIGPKERKKDCKLCTMPIARPCMCGGVMLDCIAPSIERAEMRGM